MGEIKTILAFLLAAGSYASAQLVDFGADDGDGSVNTGPSFNGTDFLWGNYFDALQSTQIVEVRVAFGRLDPLTPLTLVVYEDPDNDGDPRNATLVFSHEAESGVANANNDNIDVFTDYALPTAVQPTVENGFFVGVFISGIDGLGGTDQVADAPMRRDLDTATARGFSFFTPEGEADLMNLGSFLAFQPVGDPTVFGGLAGNPLVRAKGIVVPEPAAASLVIAAVGVLQRRRH
jgi:hypothetical protein